MRKLHVKEVYELEKDEDRDPYDLRKHKYVKGKSLAGLNEIQVASLNSLYWFNDVKNAKNLEVVVISLGKEDFDSVIGFPDMNAKIEFVLRCLKKFPKKIKEFKISIEGLSVKRGHMQTIYRVLSGMKELKIFWRSFGFQRPEKYLEKEYNLINRYLPRFKKLEEFEYDYWRYEKSCWANDEMVDIGEHTRIDQGDFQKLVQNNKPCPHVTNLTLNIVGEFFRTFEAVQQELEEELSESGGENKTRKLADQWEDEDAEDDDEDEEDNDEDYEDEDSDEEDEEDAEEEEEENPEEDPQEPQEEVKFNSEEEKKEKLREEIMPFYRFDLFPNVNTMIFQVFDDCLYPLDTFVVDGFAALKKLEFLDLTIESRPIGTHNVFDALMVVPKLQKFSLEIKFIKEKEWDILDEFFKKQEDLKSLTLIIPEERSTKEGFIQQNQHFEKLYNCINNKPNLQYLDLRSLYCSLESLSKALDQTTMVNQLKLLGVEAIDDAGMSTSCASDRVLGLCNFIKRQKESLLYLTVSLPFVFVPTILERLAEAISEVKSLKELELYINYVTEMTLDQYAKFFEKVLKKENPIKARRKLKHPKSWYPAIAEMLKNLPLLDDLTLYFGMADEVDEKFVEPFIQILREIPKIRTLNVVEFNIPFSSISKKTGEEMKEIILDMRNVSSITVDTDEIMKESYVEALESLVEHVNLRQALRCDYMF